MTLKFLESDRIDNLSDVQGEILKEMLMVVGVDPKKCLLTDSSQMSDFMWEMPGSSFSATEPYQVAFERQFERLCDAMYAKFGIHLIDKDGHQRTIVDYIDVVSAKLAELFASTIEGCNKSG